jgi:hypothetical protein
MKTFSLRLSEFKKRLLRVHDEEPLGGLSLAIIIALDLFVLTILSSGLASHTDQLTSPEEYLPYVCRQVFVDHPWTENERTAQLENVALAGFSTYDYGRQDEYDAARLAKMHPTAQDFLQKVRTARTDENLRALFAERRTLADRIGQLNSRLMATKPAYDTALLEEAVQKRPSVPLTAMTAEAQGARAEIEALAARLQDVERKIEAHPLVRDLWTAIAPGDAARRSGLVSDLRRYELKYKFVELIWQMLFLLPVFAAFWFWNARSLARSHRLQVLISSHLLVVASIPILIKIVEVVVDLVPEHFFKELFKALKAMHIIALWHFFLIALTVAAALAAIYVVQKKVFSREQLRRHRLSKGQCHACGRRLPFGRMAYCPYCGRGQTEACGGCGKETPAGGDFCVQCGQKNGRAVPS